MAALAVAIAGTAVVSSCVGPPHPVVRFGPPIPAVVVPIPVYRDRPSAPTGGPFEVGCSYTGNQLRGGVGAVFQVACPAGCEQSGSLWGTEVYTADSGVCRAGIHMGVISPAGGVVTVRLEPGRPAYRGSWGNGGIESRDYGNYGSSFMVLGAVAQPPAVASRPPPSAPPPVASQPPGPPSGPVIEPGCSFTGNNIHGPPGSSHLISCPPECKGQGGLWGTDAYTGDSRVCRAAIHAGIITNGGGMVLVTLEGARPAFRGSHRFGEESRDYGSYGSSFRVSRP